MSAQLAPPAERLTSTPGTLRAAWRRLRRSRTALLGLVLVSAFALAAVLAPWLAPHDPYRAQFAKARQGPSAEHWLGTDELGRDLLSRLIVGARISMLIGVVSVAVGAALGIPLGLVSGYYGGVVDMVAMRVVDVLLAFPSILLAIFLVAFLRPALDALPWSSLVPGGLAAAMIAVGITSVPTYARLVRASTLQARETEYVLAARAAGASDLRILVLHVLPNVAPPIVVASTLQMASAILSAAALGFLGIGAPPDVPEWGNMLQKGRQYVFSAPHLMTFPGLAILLVVMGFNLLGDGLRDALDPRLRS